jgi:hypothetical protein
MSWGWRRDDLTSGEEQSPGQDVAGSVPVRVIRVATRDTQEDRLTLTVFLGDVTTHTALLRRVPRINLDHGDT